MERAVEASTTVPAPLARARQVLLRDPGSVLATSCSSEDRRARRFRTEVAVDMGAGGSVHQEVAVEVGAALAPGEEEAVSLPLRWQATGRDRLFPAFQGVLQAARAPTGTTLRLAGTYRVPLGLLGRFGDGVAGRRLAQRSLVAFLEALSGRLDAEVHHLMAALPPSPAPVALRELPSEVYLG